MSGILFPSCPPEKVILQTSTEGSHPVKQVLSPARLVGPSPIQNCTCVCTLSHALSLPIVDKNVLFVPVSLPPGTASERGSGLLASVSEIGYRG